MERFSEIVMDHFQSPRHNHRLENADYVGLAGTPGRGPYLVLQVDIDNDRITNVGFQTHGCGPTIASGSLLSEWILGKSLDECRTLTPAVLQQMLGGLPPDKQHCAGYAVRALEQILDELENLRQQEVL